MDTEAPDAHPEGDDNDATALRFCVDEASAARRVLGPLLAQDPDGWDAGWWVRALEERDNDEAGARAWLGDWAPRREEQSLSVRLGM